MFSIRSQKATIRGLLVSRTFEKAAKPFGPLENLTPTDGECTVVGCRTVRTFEKAAKAFNFAVFCPMLFRCAKVKLVYTMRPPQATIDPLGLSESLMPMDGDR